MTHPSKRILVRWSYPSWSSVPMANNHTVTQSKIATGDFGGPALRCKIWVASWYSPTRSDRSGFSRRLSFRTPTIHSWTVYPISRSVEGGLLCWVFSFSRLVPIQDGGELKQFSNFSTWYALRTSFASSLANPRLGFLVCGDACLRNPTLKSFDFELFF